jgi:hypothetical protein
MKIAIIGLGYNRQPITRILAFSSQLFPSLGPTTNGHESGQRRPASISVQSALISVPHPDFSERLQPAT